MPTDLIALENKRVAAVQRQSGELRAVLVLPLLLLSTSFVLVCIVDAVEKAVIAAGLH
jgi:hypothetical protein